MHLQIGKKNRYLLYLFLLFFLSTINNKSLEDFDLFDLDIKKINVYGLEDEDNIEISRKLMQFIPENIFFINKEYFIDILNKNNLIHSFSIRKHYPNSIDINIIKTNFLAITNRNGKLFIIGSNGKLIRSNLNNLNLPYVFGEVEIKKFINFIEMINKSKYSIDEIKEFYYFQSGRWDIKINKEILIKLPKDDLLNSLNYSFKIINNEKFFKFKTIDLRVPNQLIIINE